MREPGLPKAGWIAGLVLACLLPTALGSASADDEQGQPAARLTPEQAAHAVLEALQAEDEKALESLAARDDPDPWLVADELVGRGKMEAALAFARAAPRKATEPLAPYLASDHAKEDATLRGALRRAVGLAHADDAAGVVAATRGLPTASGGVLVLRLLEQRAKALERLGRYGQSVEMDSAVAARAETIGWLQQAASAVRRVGFIHSNRKAFEQAKEAFERETTLRAALEDRPGEATALRSAAFAHMELWQHDEGMPLLRRALEIWKQLDDRLAVALLLSEIAYCYTQYYSDYPRALAYYERSLTVSTQLDDQPAMADTISDMAILHMSLGDYATVISLFERSLALWEKIGDRYQVLMTVLRIGAAHRNLGNFSRALSCAERALVMAREEGNALLEGLCLVEQGQAYNSLLEHERALVCFEKARVIQVAIPGAGGSQRILELIGDVHESLGDLEKALDFHQRSLALWAEEGDLYWVAVQLRRLGRILKGLGRLDDARSSLERSMAIREEIGNRFGQAVTLRELGSVHAALGDHRAAVRCLDRAVGLAKRIRSRETLVHTLQALARVRLDVGEHELALAAARQALAEIETLLGGLAEAESAAGRQRFESLFGIGALAASRLEDPFAALEFLENGRAGALLETLGAGRAALFADLPEELIQAEAKAKGAEVRARARHLGALEAGNLKTARESARTLDEAIEQRREVAARIQREAKRVAGVFYPRAAPVEEIQGWMREGTALVVYGLCLDEALAVVVTPKDQRIVGLGSRTALEAACAELVPLLEKPEEATAVEEGLARLRSRLIEPLGLGEDVQSLLVSPAGALGYVPWGALLDLPVTSVPSGTTWVLLQEEEWRPGTKILALGDPVYDTRPGDRTVETYRGGKLRPLPATRDEAKAIGDTVLLGAGATEAGLVAALRAEERWRALHLACHGLVDVERPLLSSLALTPDAEEDGFLTWMDVFRMQIPADLVVLSACETARGKVTRAEGIVGLTRAFMYAGTPRVICSLWKVDDEATRALMVKFYELWNPRASPADPERPKGVEGSKPKALGAAEALREAQAFVRGHERWNHPYYWAAWVLWGLPE